MTMLVTGFPRFDSFPQNSTHQLISLMRDDLPPELREHRSDVAFEIVGFDNDDSDVQQQTMLASYRALMDRHQPDVCLFCGQAAARPRLSLETLAVNVFKGKVIDPQGPPAYWATLPNQDALVETLNGANIPAELSYHAGTHLCNHILYTGLQEAATAGIQRQLGFLHLPMTATQVIDCDEQRPFIPLQLMREALTVAVRHLLNAGS